MLYQGIEPGRVVRADQISHFSLDPAATGFEPTTSRDLNLDQSPQIHGRVVRALRLLTWWALIRSHISLDTAPTGFEPGPLIRSHISLDTAHDGIRTRNLRDQIRDLNLDQSDPPQIHGRVVELSD